LRRRKQRGTSAGARDVRHQHAIDRRGWRDGIGQLRHLHRHGHRPGGRAAEHDDGTITLYSTGHGPQVLQSTQRKTLALGTGATELAEIVLDTGGEAPVLPLKLSLIGVATPASGISIRLRVTERRTASPMSTTVTLTANTAAEDDSNLYPGASAASHTLYGFYEIPSANVQAPPTPVITAVGTNPAPAGANTQFTASETNGNGFPYLTGTYSFALDTAALGTITSGGLLTAGTLDADRQHHRHRHDGRTRKPK